MLLTEIVVEATPGVGEGISVYRFYVQMQDATDRMSAVFGNDEANLTVNTPLVRSAARSTRAGMLLASTLRSCLWFQTWRMNVCDDWLLDGPASTSGIAGAADPSVVEDASQPITPYNLTNGATSLESTTLTGASWYDF